MFSCEVRHDVTLKGLDQGPMDGKPEFGAFSLAELKIFHQALTDKQVEALHAKTPRPPA